MMLHASSFRPHTAPYYLRQRAATRSRPRSPFYTATRLASSVLKLEKLPACDYQSAAFFWTPLENSPASTFLSGSNQRNAPLPAANLGAFYLFGERERDAITTLTIIFIIFFMNPMLLTHAYSFHSHPLKMPRSNQQIQDFPKYYAPSRKLKPLISKIPYYCYKSLLLR